MSKSFKNSYLKTYSLSNNIHITIYIYIYIYTFSLVYIPIFKYIWHLSFNHLFLEKSFHLGPKVNEKTAVFFFDFVVGLKGTKIE